METNSNANQDNSLAEKKQKVWNRWNVRLPNPEDQADVNEIINKYISVIEQSSELSKEEKELIYSSLSVAAYSFKYWEKELQ